MSRKVFIFGYTPPPCCIYYCHIQSLSETDKHPLVFTGVFTAPAAGVYYFTFFYHAGGQHASNLELFKNSEMIVRSSDHQTGSDGADNGGNTVILQLQQGDHVYVSMPANHHVWAAENSTSFSGFLLS